MSLLDILTEVARKTGMELDNVGHRQVLVDEINKAARELWRKKDLPASLQEVFIRVTANYEMSMPGYISELRAVRSGCEDYCTTKWQLQSMYPRFNKTEWEQQWKNFRVKGYSPIAYEWLNAAPVTIQYPTVDPSLVVTIVGETTTSNNTKDIITMSEASMEGTKGFLTPLRILKNKITEHNVVVVDASGNETAIIYADQLESKYLLVDISKYPTEMGCCCSCPDGSFIMELLYKPVLPYMYDDADGFPVPDFDDVITTLTLRNFAGDQEGKETRAMMLDESARRQMEEISGDKGGHIARKMNVKRNPFFMDNYGGGGWRW